DEPLHAWDLSPVAVERFEGQLDAGLEAHEPVWPGSDRRPAEAGLAHLLEVLLRHDPGGAGRARAVERHEVGPRVLQVKPDSVGVPYLHVAHAVLEASRRRGGGA